MYNFISRMFPLLSVLFCPIMLSLEGEEGAGGGGGDAAAAAAAAATAAAGGGGGGQAGPILDASGKFMPGWSKQLGVPDTLEAKFSDPKSLVGSYVSLEKLISAKGIIKPGANATPAEISAYHQALGAPAKPEEYALAKPETIKVDGKDVPVPAELWDKDAASAAQTLFHQLGLTKEQAAALMQFDLTRGLKGTAAFTALREKQYTDAVTALKSEWGPNYDAQVKAANDAAAKAGLTPELLKSNPDLANNPLFVKAMAAVGKMILEAPAAGLRGNANSDALNPDAEIKAIMNDPKHAWHPQNAKVNPSAHAEAVAHMKRLFQLKHGEAA